MQNLLFQVKQYKLKNLIPKYIIFKGQVIPILKIKYVGL